MMILGAHIRRVTAYRITYQWSYAHPKILPYIYETQQRLTRHAV
jgi:hypothetical protein